MIPIYKPWITSLEKDYVNQAMNSGWISSQGEFIQRFEDNFAKFLDVKYAVAVNNGTSACHLALLSSGIRKNDEVIIPDITYIATANAVKYCGAKPVIVDVNKKSWNIDEKLLEKCIGPKTRAIFAVHLLGNPANIEFLSYIKEKYQLLIIEDAAEALGAKYNNKFIGSIFDSAAFSFFGNKTITTGEGGMVTTNNEEIYKNILLYKGQGQTEKYFHPVIGYNYRMTNVAAAIGCAQLERIDEIQKEKSRVYRTYTSLLPQKMLQKTDINSVHGEWIFAIKINKKTYKKLLEQKIFDIRPLFKRISSMPTYKKNSYQENSVAKKLEKTVLMLPSYPELTENQITKICKTIIT